MKRKYDIVWLALLTVGCLSLLLGLSRFRASNAQSLDEQTYLPYISRPVVTPTPSPTSTSVATATSTPPVVPTAPSTPIPPPTGMIYIDHTAVELFDHIPEQYLNLAAGLDMLFVNRSVGGQINDGLTCLATPWTSAPNNCKRHEHVVPEFSADPEDVFWQGTYNRSNWDYLFWPGMGGPQNELDCTVATDLWFGKLECFIQHANSHIDEYDVLSFQFSYLEVSDDSDIASLSTGFFADTPNYDVLELEAFEAQHSDKTVIYWTTSLSRGIGSQVSDTFNELMRHYAMNNDKILFDVADILSYDLDGNPCYDNRDGVPYDNGNNSENHPDDGLNLRAICQQYTTEVDGGHLGSVSTGKIRVAKAFWVLMAQIAGWDPSTVQQ